ncbi:uncharacterized protein G2W53_030466 [Senna tora]|uniref:Uncharacterized protein n=1 Tax=Senna tora TaxID=362788 RepID=A0A834T987_9FABA|nr:uncharacterized protein G2W53_030466 [Senna tora]
MEWKEELAVFKFNYPTATVHRL